MSRSQAASAVENDALKDIILARIEAEGSISFRDFMALALYDAEHGYYLTHDPTADYQTSPQVHPVFGAVVGSQLAEMWRALDRPARFEVFEDGAGNGALAAGVLAWARQADPDFYDSLRYRLRDAAPRRAAANALLAGAGLPPNKAAVCEEWPENLVGCVLTNELLDAFPVHRVHVDEGRLLEIRVASRAGHFVEETVEASVALREYFDALGLLPGEGCDAEVNLDAPRWLARAAASLARGYVMTFDYGYLAAELYAPWRRRGTLLTFCRHTAGDDPYVRLGCQDITASVDFSTLIRSGEAHGLRSVGLTRQVEFLASLGIGEALARRPARSELEAYYALRRAVLELTDASGLGRIKALLQSKGAPDGPFSGFGTTEGSRD